MVQTPTQSKKLSIQLPDTLLLQVTQSQFETLALLNRDLRLERTATGDLIVNPPTGWETGERNCSLTGQLYRWYEDHEDLRKSL